TENGVVNLDTLECLSPAPAYRITKVCGAAFDPRARAPLFEQTLADVFNRDAPMIEFFQRLVGYAACGQPTEDLLVIPFGNGANGKSTVLGTIRRALGHYAKAAEAASFVTDGNSGGSAGSAREDLVRLRGARLVYVNEPDDGGELREGSVKSMAGGDAITARAPYAKASVEIVPTWVAFMPTNHLPIVKGSDNGIWRRLMPIPFERNFESDPTIVKDPRREEKLLAELPGVLAWILQGATLYKQMGLAPPDSVKRARDSYRSRMDLLAEWLDECCDIAPGYACEASLLWQSWEPFAKARGITQYIRSNIALGRKLDARFPAVKGTGGVRMRTGLRVRDPFRVLNSGLPHDLF
ncbi:MAG: phage/plasmid primase, P4 family, partial [Daejeonella sp.]|nr:phage/plasmid primase, P4 family [Daejeonella sp.]